MIVAAELRHHAPAKPRHAHRRDHRHSASRPVHRQPRYHPRPGHKDLAQKTLVESGLDHLSLRVQGLAAAGDGPAELDRTVLSRRGDSVCRRSSAMLLLPRDDANRFRAAWEKGNGVADIRAREIDAVLHRERLERGKKRLHPLPMPVEQAARRCDGAAGGGSFLIVQGRALQWSMAGYARRTAQSITRCC